MSERQGAAGIVGTRVGWRQRAAAGLSAVWFAGAAVHHATLGLGAVRLRCLLVGHDDRFKREPDRLYLRCEECGRMTRGWAIATNAPPHTAPLIARKAPIVPFRSTAPHADSPTLHLVRDQRRGVGTRS